MYLSKRDQTLMKIMVLTNAAILAAILLSGCSAATSDGPLMHYELDGTWCTSAAPVETCLTVIHPTDSPPASSYYVLSRGLCYEQGHLTGGLEFTPDTTSRLCLPNITSHSLYSASGEWTATGIRLAIDQSDGRQTSETLTLEMDFRP